MFSSANAPKFDKSLILCLAQDLYIIAHNKSLDWNKFEAFADEKLQFAEMGISFFDGVENIVGSGENADFKHFSHTVFKMLL